MSSGVRRFVLGFLVVFVGTSAAGLEAWPLNGWGLYSRRLTDRVEEWTVRTVDTAGTEHGVPWDRLPMAYRATYRQLPDVVASSRTEQERSCRAWAGAVEEVGGDVAEVRIYWTETRRHFDGTRAVERQRLELTCAERAP